MNMAPPQATPPTQPHESRAPCAQQAPRSAQVTNPLDKRNGRNYRNFDDKPKWRNWQTRRTQNPLLEITCRFKSDLRYQPKISSIRSCQTNRAIRKTGFLARRLARSWADARGRADRGARERNTRHARVISLPAAAIAVSTAGLTHLPKSARLVGAPASRLFRGAFRTQRSNERVGEELGARKARDCLQINEALGGLRPTGWGRSSSARAPRPSQAWARATLPLSVVGVNRARAPGRLVPSDAEQTLSRRLTKRSMRW